MQLFYLLASVKTDKFFDDFSKLRVIERVTYDFKTLAIDRYKKKKLEASNQSILHCHLGDGGDVSFPALPCLTVI